MRTQEHLETKPIRFRAATLDEAVELAEQSLGARARVVEANQLRRGGIGGFFASDLGVEISVVVDDETVEDALVRMVDEVAAGEREHWRERGGQDTGHQLADEFAATMREIEEMTTPSHEPVAPSSPEVIETRPAVEPEFILSALSCAEAGVKARMEIGTQARQDAATVATANTVATAPTVPTVAPVPTAPTAAPAPAAATVPSAAPAPPAPTATLSRVERLEAAFASLHQSSPMQTKAKPSVPTQRQVELVVAAAEQLMESIVTRAQPGNITVRVVMRNSEGAEVEAFAGLDNRVGAES